MTPYRQLAERFGGDDPGDHVLDPSDPTSLTLDVAVTNPAAYASRFTVLPAAKRIDWLSRATVRSLRVHFHALQRARGGGPEPLRARLVIRPGECIVHSFSGAEARLPFPSAASLVTQTRRLARALEVGFVLDLDAKLPGVWRGGLVALRRTIPDAEPVSVQLHVERPWSERGEDARGRWFAELGWRSALLGLEAHTAELVSVDTTEATHADEADRAVTDARALSRALRVPFSKADR